MLECPVCLKRAFVWTYDGKNYCAHCTKKEWTWNTEKMLYEENK